MKQGTYESSSVQQRCFIVRDRRKGLLSWRMLRYHNYCADITQQQRRRRSVIQWWCLWQLLLVVLLMTIVVISPIHIAFIHALQQPSSPTSSSAIVRDSHSNTNNNNADNNNYAALPSVQQQQQQQQQQRLMKPTTAMIVSTKRNGGHTIRYNIIDSTDDDSNGSNNYPALITAANNMGVAVDDRTLTTVTTSSSSVDSVRHQLAVVYIQYIQRCWNTVIRRTTGSTLFQRHHWGLIYARIASGLRSTFLPIGYPTTVPDQYLSYVVWSSLQDLCTSVRSVIATQRVLQGIGVGTNTATTLSAIQNFILRDAAGMIASLSFTSFTSGIFSKDIKRWRLFADCIVDIGITLEVMAVQLPKSYFVPMLCIANMCKAMCGVAAGATSGSIALYWSSKANSAAAVTGTATSNSHINTNDKSKTKINDNMDSTDISDINAKFGAQNTVTGSFGLIFSAIFARSVATAPLSFVWVIYSMLTVFHIYANMRCMRIIAFPQFNTLRFNHVVASFFNQWRFTSTAMGDTSLSQQSSNDTMNVLLPTPKQVANVESLFFISNPSKLLVQRRRLVPIHFGVSFNEYTERCSTTPIDTNHIKNILLDTTSKMMYPYLISIGSSKSSSTNKNILTPENCCIVVAVPTNTNSYTQAQAYFHATLYRQIIHEVASLTTIQQQSNATDRVLDIVEQRVTEIFPLAWEQFATACTKTGWDLSRTELHSNGYEIAYQE